MKFCVWNLILVVGLMFGGMNTFAQENVRAKNASNWELSGRVQLQYLNNTDTESDASRTTNGFRIRRGRLQTKANLNSFVSAKFQIEVRDNSPRLKDAEAKIKLFKSAYVKFGQFKVPVWREEFMRSSGKLLLVERSEAAEFLADNLLSARHVGLEFGSKVGDKVHFAVNFSNGAGEGIREDAGRSKSDAVNNGKMLVGRVDVDATKNVKIGISGAANNLGNEIGDADNTGAVTVIAPDFGVYLDSGFDIEGGIAFGNVSKDLLGVEDAHDRGFTVFDVTGRWKKKLDKKSENLGGLDAFELAAGFGRVDPDTDVDNDEESFFRFGPAVYFGSKTRLQLNGEIEMPSADGADSVFKIRSQLTVNL